MGVTRRRGTKKYLRRKTRKQLHCHIRIQAQVKTSSSQPEESFYQWVNSSWLSKAKIPAHEANISVSDEVESCVEKKLLAMVTPVPTGPFGNTVSHLLKSVKTIHTQDTSVTLLHKILGTVGCVNSAESLASHLGELTSARIASLFSLSLNVLPSNHVDLCITPDPAGVNTYDRTPSYRHMLRELGKLVDIPDLHTVIPFERRLNDTYDRLYKDAPAQKTTLRRLIDRFPAFDWKSWMQAAINEEWDIDRTIYVRNIPFIAFLMRQIKHVPIQLWRLFLARIYVVHAAQYLPPPFNTLHFNYFNKILKGQKSRLPQDTFFLKILAAYQTEPLSRRLWDEIGDSTRLRSFRAFTHQILDAAQERMETVEWMRPATRVAAAAKLKKVRLELARPRSWDSYEEPPLVDDSLLKNIYELGRWNTHQSLKRTGRPYSSWEEGIFVVNAYYFNENNEVMIPYASILTPFYNEDAPLGWNHGSIGATIGHELCHGFDDDGKDYNPKGEHKTWWKPSDLKAYKHTTRRLIRLYNKQRILGRPVDGKKTLSENIADIAGVGIALDALKKELVEKGVEGEARRRALQTFFIAFAVSWRTKTRPEKARLALLTDKHAPAELRVNLVVNQFDEFYEAFDVAEGNPMWRAPSARIRIF